MKFSIRFADKIVGTLVILALAMLVFVIFMLGSNQRWFVRDIIYVTYLNSASGVSPNMAIQYKGFTIGNVKKIELANDDRVEISITIFEEYAHRVTEGSLVEVSSSPIPGFGGGFIFHPGKGLEQLPEGTEIPEISSLEARKYIASGLADKPAVTGLDINNIINQVTGILEGLNLSLSGAQGSEDLPLGIVLNDISKITTSLVPIIRNFESISYQASAPGGTIMNILDGDGAFYTGLEDSIVSLSGIISDLNKITEFFPPQLPQIAVLISQVNTSLLSLQDILVSVANNPLLRGGIPQRIETGPGGASPRNLDF